MSGRQPNGRPTIYKGADGRYHCKITLGIKDDGSLDRRHRSGRTKSEVERKIKDLTDKRDAGHVPGKGRPPTVEQWIAIYLDTITKRDLAPRTYDDYWSKSRNWIIPHLGKHRLDRLQPEHLDALYTTMANAGKAPSHILKVHRILSRALKIAVRRGHIARNVAALIDAPSVSESEIEPFSTQETRAILAAAENRSNPPRWSIGLALGLRQGEALGLRWNYVDLENGQLRVYWQLQRTGWRHGCGDPHACGWRLDSKGRPRHRTNACRQPCKQHTRPCPKPCPPDCTKHASTCPQRKDGGLVFREPKGKSKRIVPLAPQLVPVLRTHRAAQRRQRLAAGSAWQEHDLVFCRVDGAPIDPRDDFGEWKDLLAQAKVRDGRLHDGRHTAATLLLEQGVDVRVVMEFLGHSDLRVTQRYTHVASPMTREAAQRVGQALWGS